jgi:hypothetical protein
MDIFVLYIYILYMFTYGYIFIGMTLPFAVYSELRIRYEDISALCVPISTNPQHSYLSKIAVIFLVYHFYTM